MAQFTIKSCTFNDGPAIANAFISSFWTDESWRIIWAGKSREYVVSQAARRMPKILLRDSTHERHQKVVDTETGVVVAYSRWTFPELEDIKVEDLWPAARVPGVTPEQEKEAEAEYSAADYTWDNALDGLDQIVGEKKDRLMEGKKYLGE